MPNPEGRPTDYREEYIEQAFNFALLGLDDEEMAEQFDVAESTFHLWKKKHPKFSESVNRGKVIADGKVARGLYKRSKGFKKKVRKVFMEDGLPIEKDVEMYFPPDGPSARNWLSNRQGKYWKEKLEVEHSGGVSILDMIKNKGDDEK